MDELDIRIVSPFQLSDSIVNEIIAAISARLNSSVTIVAERVSRRTIHERVIDIDPKHRE